MSKLQSPFTLAWCALIALTLVFLAVQGSAGWLVAYPEDWVVPITPLLNSFMDWCVDVFGPFILLIAHALNRG